MLTKFLDCF